MYDELDADACGVKVNSVPRSDVKIGGAGLGCAGDGGCDCERATR